MKARKVRTEVLTIILILLLYLLLAWSSQKTPREVPLLPLSFISGLPGRLSQDSPEIL